MEAYQISAILVDGKLVFRRASEKSSCLIDFIRCIRRSAAVYNSFPLRRQGEGGVRAPVPDEGPAVPASIVDIAL